MSSNIFSFLKFNHMQRTLYQLCVFTMFLGLGLYSSGCLAPYGFQTGRAMGQGNGEVSFELSIINLEGAIVPSPNIAGRIGLTDKMDVGLVMGASSFPYVYTRYQVVGDLYSPVALSLGAGIGYIGFLPQNNINSFGGGYAHFPLYFSLHSNDFAWYLTPQYSFFFSSLGNASVFSGSTGIEYSVSKRIALGLNLGLSKNFDSSAGVFTAGLGLKFRFGS